jgi:DNA-binding transcriptional LysR family regulator
MEEKDKGVKAMKDSDWEILYELYKNPNMSKVASLLFMTQPSLTKRLQHMESEFQVTIVNRTPKGLEFTREGEFLAKQAEIYLDFMKETNRRLDELKESAEENIIIGSSYTYSKYTLTDVLYQYNQTHSNVNFHIVNDQSNILFRKLLEGAVDVGFIRGDYEGAVNKVLIAQNQAYLITREKVDFDQLPHLQRIAYRTNDRTKELLNEWWQDRFDTAAPSGMEVGFIDFAWQLISKGLGYTSCFLPNNFANENNLCLTPLTKRDGSPVIRNTWFIYPKNKRRSKMLEDFIHYVEREIAIR